MEFQLYANKRLAEFYLEDTAWSGVRKITEKVCNDVNRVTGVRPEICGDLHAASDLVIIGTIGKSAILEQMEREGHINLEAVREGREVYSFQIVQRPMPFVERALVIAGSDKRGTIYGLFHISELIGVSPLVDWNDVKPKQLERIIFDERVNVISKEPSVKIRGFFINDEWPAFGNWCMKNFGGFNAKAYEHVFELLLRLKGNYLWPAMWSARFQDDGPGLLNAELADELGIIMGMSHHEPCLRQGEEYKYLRGANSVYGDAWNFRTNKEGITKFWEDGLKRSGKFENVITVGMRGEADTAILGEEATLADNIQLLRDVLQTQRRLIKENVCDDLAQVPRMIALYKEVEEFFYGNKEVPGLIGSKDLEDVILMLCDDNFGNLRTLPTEEMLKHKGGYGMYYHFDYHGSPISFEWINSSYLPKIWEQMSMAYDFGIRDLWIVNVGDICTQEFPLSYFLDMAYDFDRWGTKAINHTDKYTRQWIERQFNGVFDETDQQSILQIVNGYTKIVHKRRPEAMNAGVYHSVNYKETQKTLEQIDEIIDMADKLYRKLDKEELSAYFSLVYYPAVGTLNVHRMQLLTGLNHYFAKLGALVANSYATMVEECMKCDRSLIDEYHTIDNGKWYGMGMSEHIGFIHWNEDECQNPILMHVLPANKARIMVTVDGTTQHAEGSPWLNNRLYLNDFLEPDVYEASFSLYSISDNQAEYEINCMKPWIKCSAMGGILSGDVHTWERITVQIDKNQIHDDDEGEIHVKTPSGECVIVVSVKHLECENIENKTYIQTKGYIAIEAENYFLKKEGKKQQAEFRVIEGYGKTKSAVKAYPTTEYFTPGEDAPYLEYHFIVEKEGGYEVQLYMQPSNPVTTDNLLLYGIRENDSDIRLINAIPVDLKVGDSGQVWADGVLDNIRKQTSTVVCKKGLNILRIYAVTPGFVLEKIVIYPEGKAPADSFLGPTETYYVGRSKDKYQII